MSKNPKRRSNPWKTLSSRIVHTNPYYRIRRDAVVKPDEKSGFFAVTERPSSMISDCGITDGQTIVALSIAALHTE